jgi:anaphase-promoting complex subunit 2
VKLQQRYEHGFESLKNSRKLTWLHALGQATVELELRDRTIYEEVHTWQATVIWAFQSNDESNDESVESPAKSVGELVEHLEMDETLVRSALNFWVGKMVLREFCKDEYVVLETLNQEDLAKSNAQAAAAAAAASTEIIGDDAALIANDDLASEKMQMYWQFIQGMLTNSSPQMPLQQIAMMLKMLIVDGFPYSNEELQEFLGRKVKEGALEFVAGKYKLKK